MDTSNIVALVLGGIGFIISIINFFLTPILNLKSKRLEKRLEYRFALFQKILELWECTNESQLHQQKNFIPLMSEVNKFIQLYGHNSEIKLFKEFGKAYKDYTTEQDEIKKLKLNELAIQKGNDFFSTSFNAYRKEIVLDKLDYNNDKNK